ncbi:hypothetical protein AVEN_209578-1 [Araneus ventricosus]|uniref:Uncharacterized protein n=1 Tax=Araneus ventricosus TaxID=182803 RepID=A0A4Y2RLZ4_ARAVE|nr:hypothetical protein AVEN_209578-1 [Araneus ventricosus]
MLDIVEHYRFACSYFLDDYIQILWDQLPEESKRYFYNGERPPRDTKPPLDFCWPYILNGEGTKLDNRFQTPFEYYGPTTFIQYLSEYSVSKAIEQQLNTFLERSLAMKEKLGYLQ